MFDGNPVQLKTAEEKAEMGAFRSVFAFVKYKG